MTKLDETCKDPTGESCPFSDRAAKKAVREVFYIFGVDIDDPAQVKEFQEDLRFSSTLRGMANKGLMATVVVGVTFFLGAMALGLKQKFLGGP
jgi:hypothetical protein